MTKEEAIKQLNVVVQVVANQNTIDAIEMAIKALEQQPCKDEDIATAFQFGMAMGFAKKYDEMDRVIKEVKKAVTPKEKTGHWIDDADKIDAQFGRHTYKCSECGKYAEYFVSGTGVWWNRIKPNFCPNCGARMVSE